MTSIVMYYMAVVVAFDAIYMSVIGHAAYSLLFLPSIGLVVIARKTKKSVEKLVAVEGLDLGMGEDIENPDNPSVVRVFLEKSAIYLGFLFVGGPGSGKSIAAIRLLLYFTEVAKHGWIYFEGKGDLDIYQKNVACGNSPDKFFSTELESTDTTNITSGKAEDVIELLTKTLIRTENEFYKNEQSAALSDVVYLLKSLDIPVNLRDIYVTLKVDGAGDHVMALAKEKGARQDIIETARQFFDQEPEKRNEYIKGLLTNMGRFVTGDIADRLNEYNPTLDLEIAAKENQKVYMHMPLTEVAKSVATMFTEQLGVIAKNRQLYQKVRTPWPINFDDWGAFFYEGFGPITARCRSAKMPCSFFFQSKGQTDKVEAGHVFTTEILDNIGGLIGLKVNGIFTAELVSKQFGMYETTELSANSQRSGENVNVAEKPRVRADKMKDLDSGECYIDTVVTGSGGRSQNRRFKARFPMPDFPNADNIEWPVIEEQKIKNRVVGLNLWEEFMNRDRVAKLEEEVVAESIGSAQVGINNSVMADESSAVDYL